jgi:hypothetical protein
MNRAEFGLYMLVHTFGVRKQVLIKIQKKKLKNYLRKGKIVRNFQKIQAYEFCSRKDDQTVIQNKRKCQ